MVDRPSRPSVPQLVIITPVYDEVDCLPLYVEAVTRVILDRQDVAASVLFIDDGSTDKSWDAIAELCDRDKRFHGIRLSRNVGSHTATMAALHNLPEDVDAVVIMGCDLQDPPETTLALLDEWRSGADIVWAQRRSRDDPVGRRVGSKAFHTLLRRSMPRGSLITAGGFILMDQRVVSAVAEMKEQNRVTFALVAWTGFNQARVLYDRPKRVAGKSGWSPAKMMKTSYDAFIGFSTLPLRIMRTVAAIAALGAGVLSIYLIAHAATGHPVRGLTSTLLVPSVFFAIQFGLMAIAGEYLHRIYGEVVHRPPYFISEQTAASGDSTGRT